MRNIVLFLSLTVFAVTGFAASPKMKAPFEKKGKLKSVNSIDQAVRRYHRKFNIKSAAPCSDEVFVRRVYLDVIGTLPTPTEVVKFLRNREKDKREKLIDHLLERPEFADYWSLKWCDLLRVKAEFPINMWPNAVQAYHRWIHDSIRTNRPYDEFARMLLTSSGSNFRVPAVNFYRGVQDRKPAGLAQAAALTFMGARFEKWPEDRRKGMEAFFSRVAYKKTVEWKEEIVHLAPPSPSAVRTMFPDGSPAMIAPNEDPRQLFADWLIRPGNPWFTKNIVNRVWFWLVGRGVVHAPDDIREDNPPANPDLLKALEKELVKAKYDLKELYRLILNSSTYQQSPVPRDDDPRTESLFGHYIVRRLPAEVLIDALCNITGSSVKYMSAIPEPFTFIPEERRTIALSDGSITSPFLEMFGRPARDTGLESERNDRPTGAQRLHLLNSTDIQGRIERSPRLGKLLLGRRKEPGEKIRQVYLLILSREPTEVEVAAIMKYFASGIAGAKQAADDVVWALINSKEFLYRH
ncbi:MAG: DUF1553 domain-containing protein [Planctomycetota bacterium]